MSTETKLLREFVQASDAQDPDFDALAWIERARLASAADTTDWRELCRRLYVELFHCDQQMTQSNVVRKRPIFKQGVTVFERTTMDRETLLRKMNEAMDDVLVEAAASMMRHKLAKARDKGRGGWWNPKECTAKGLREAMDRHTEKGDPVDVMNLAAMVAVREMLEPPNAEITGG